MIGKVARVRRVNSVNTSSEPIWKEKSKPKRLDIIKALNWYNVEKDEKDAAKILKASPSIARNHMTYAWLTRMLERGFVLPEQEAATFKLREASFKEAMATIAPTADPVNVISIQERTKQKSEEIIGEMQGLIDEYGIRGEAAQLNAYQWMIDYGVKPIHANRIAEFFRERSKEIFEAAQGKNKDLKEGYTRYGKSRLLNLLQAHANIIKDALKLASNASKMRKPRKKKPISFDKMVAKIKYLVKDDKLKLQSIDPVRIIGTQQLWVYNVKTRKLGVYNALSDTGLQMKGTTMQNYSVDTSIAKTLRKPEKILPIVTDGGKIQLRKILDGVNSKPIKMNGRINKDTLLLRVV